MDNEQALDDITTLLDMVRGGDFYEDYDASTSALRKASCAVAALRHLSPGRPSNQFIEALNFARNRIDFLGLVAGERHEKSNEQDFLPRIDAALAALPAPSEAIPVGREDERVKQIWQSLLDKDDRTSPEEYPDMVLITYDELAEALTPLVLGGDDIQTKSHNKSPGHALGAESKSGGEA